MIPVAVAVDKLGNRPAWRVGQPPTCVESGRRVISTTTKTHPQARRGTCQQVVHSPAPILLEKRGKAQATPPRTTNTLRLYDSFFRSPSTGSHGAVLHVGPPARGHTFVHKTAREGPGRIHITTDRLTRHTPMKRDEPVETTSSAALPARRGGRSRTQGLRGSGGW